MDKTKNGLRSLAAALAFCLGFVLLFTLASRVLGDKMSYKYTQDFYAGNEEYEVLFLGSSHVMDGVLPLELYHDTGIASYNFAMTGEGMAATYGKAVYALQTHAPQLVVLDVYAINDTVKVEEQKLGFLHNSLDNMPLCPTKIQVLADLFDGNLNQIFNYLFPLSTYHARYAELTEDDFSTYVQEDKGALPLVNLAGETDWGVPPSEEKGPGGAVGTAYLRKILDLCGEKNIPVLLTALPYRPQPDEIAGINGAADIAAEYGVNFLNGMFGDEIDPRVDFSDPDGHLNISGATKATRWLGDYITANYDITPKSDASQAESWQQSYQISLNQFVNKLQSTADLHSALMLLAHSGISYRVTLDAAHLADARTQAFLENLGHDEDWAVLVQSGAPYSCASADAPAGEGAPNSITVWSSDTGEELAALQF